MKDIACSCESTFQVDVPDWINLDADPDSVTKILDGTFFAFACPSCGRIVKPELPVQVRWPSAGATIAVALPEERESYLKDPATLPASVLAASSLQLVFGHAELSERIQELKDGLEPMAVEALKYYLLLKAEEAAPEAECTVRYYGQSADGLEFHIHGLREGEVAATMIPRAVYDRTLGESRAGTTAEPFASLRSGAYVSVNALLSNSGDEA